MPEPISTLIGLGLAVVAIIAAFLKGRSDGRKLAGRDQYKAREKIQEKYDEIDRRPRDPDDAYQRLRDRAGRR